MTTYFIPVTPAGTPILWGLNARAGKLMGASTREDAIANLLEDAQHMPYESWEEFEKRGYTIHEFENWPHNVMPPTDDQPHQRSNHSTDQDSNSRA